MFKLWLFDQLADIGGFLIFIGIFFWMPAAAVQNQLYFARILQDSYRVKFNKLLKGIKDDNF
jgi:hypothetical protein